ncbi:alpha/beta hydrolase [Nocardia sp. AG03]|uniref:alpha/beta hydrolase n=1 Tax=Nocardia sp. AG03 TaxID=3025312 RepID=UPI0024182396|nr:alpha/beta hydrolase [Nocardia sp. AG03]
MTGPATKSQAYAIQPGALEAQLSEWRSLHDRLVANLDLAQRDYAGSTSYWVGNAGDRARETTTTTVTEGRKITAALDSAITAGSSGQASIAADKSTATAAIDLAEKDKFTVAEDGTVTAPDARLSLPDADLDDITAAQAALDATAKNVYESPIKAALLSLGQTIENTTVAIEKAFENVGAIKPVAQSIEVSLGERSQQVQDILDGKTGLPTDAEEFHELWSTLSDEDKDALWNQDHYLGNRDGMPAEDRDHYNRLLLTEQLTAAQTARDEAKEIAGDKHEQWLKYTGASVEDDQWLKQEPGYAEWKSKMEESRHLEDLVGTSNALEPQAEDGEPRLLLGMDDKSGERVRAIVADGNPDTASHVTTYVPGTGSQPSKLDGDMDRVDRMSDQAEDSGASNPVTIAWMGYDAPPELGDATQRDYAEAGAPALNAFQDGLRVTHEGESSRNTVLGHSYGTTVVGLSAAEGRTLDADTVVMVASPGAGVDTARDLSLTGVPDGQQYTHVFSTRAENDPTPLYENLPGVVPGLDRHGEDPTESEFGGQVFTSDPGTSTPVLGYSFPSHSEYWDLGNTSLVNMGHIIAGNLGEVTYE